jgi:hypothetical protein
MAIDLKNTVLGEVLQRTRQIKSPTLWRRVFSDPNLQRWILDLIRKNQLLKAGVDEDGVIIGVYSPVTQAINPKKKAGTPYTLFDTGDFYRSMIIYLGTNFFDIDADPIKGNDNLFKKYGDGIIGLTEESKERLRRETQRRYEIELRKLLRIN